MHGRVISYQTDLNFDQAVFDHLIIYPTIATESPWQLNSIRKNDVGGDRISTAKHQFGCSIGCCSDCK